ncbi:MAG: hypothetical protein COY66_01245 [Candidatus Kerfeldbacteria bacterium CG_4_10_14_0_8_um_filter_42_10]|uniref:Uncharacterized protein n=1 Tax=Candidatus Kerfeldbacteria bacterium CG_4_10_14_0_8_um_filter_42_10 TaxID=2014248 RepID=A0A2M7RK79_9BACT|nr:MAG: hypothetical protein COY66_01245 [Candidatus Kerfeldbacteria bacterium CG_4_10_14_0_8_um_filter_42_10]
MGRLTLLVQSETTHDPTIAVSWCMDRELVKQLADLKAVDAQILLVTYDPKTHFEHRYLRPLSEGMEHVQFHNSGKQKIFAAIVWDEKGPKKLRQTYLTRNNYKYSTDVVDHSTNELYEVNSETTLCDLECQTEIAVNVEKALFAKKPFDWGWVMMFRKDDKVIIDQCQYRKYRLIAYPLNPLAILGCVIVAIIAAAVYVVGTLAAGITATVLFLFGMKVCWRAVYGWSSNEFDWPYKTGKYNTLEWKDIWNEADGTYFTKDVSWIFRPGILVVLAYLVMLVANTPVLQLILASLVGLIVAGLIVYGTNKVAKKTAYSARVSRIETNLQPLLCENLISGADDISTKGNRSAHLMFTGVKAKVCRPFARG